jgi:hypothetical protein
MLSGQQPSTTVVSYLYQITPAAGTIIATASIVIQSINVTVSDPQATCQATRKGEATHHQ